MRTFKTYIFILLLGACASTSVKANTPPAPSTDQPQTMDQVVDRVISNEQDLYDQMRNYSPLVETYIQNLKADKKLGEVPVADKYFLGRANFQNGINLVSLTDNSSRGKKTVASVGNFFNVGMQYLPDGFLQMIFIDTNGFGRQHYKFNFVRREFLGEVRCMVFDITPAEKAKSGRFTGRIWVEDHDYHIVRFNGEYNGHGHMSCYFHFDSWRTNVKPGLWMPTFVYSEERDLRYDFMQKVSFKAQTRLWGYNLGGLSKEEEVSKILVETPVTDETSTANDISPIEAQHLWDRQAEDNSTERLERVGLLAPKGEIDKVLETVLNNLEVTNNIDPDPEIRCRVLMTSTLESFTVGHTIVLSRGLIDVLPDEASLAAMLAHELSHVLLGHRLGPQYAFFDQVMVDDKDTFRHFGFAHTAKEEAAANAKAMQILGNSPYADKLANAGLFLQALEARQKEIPNLISGHLGNNVPHINDLKSAVSADPKENPQTISALPIGGRVKIDPWNDKLGLIKSKPVGTLAEREKMAFEVTPFMPYLTGIATDAAKPITASASTPEEIKLGQSPDLTKP